MTLETPDFKRFVTVSYDYGQLRVETCTLADHLEALRVRDRMEKALRAAIPEGLWPCLALEISQDRSLAENVDGPRSHITLYTLFQIMRDTEPQRVIQDLQARTLDVLRRANFGFSQRVEERTQNEQASSSVSDVPNYIA